jgi:hypothetical protein
MAAAFADSSTPGRQHNPTRRAIGRAATGLRYCTKVSTDLMMSIIDFP